MFIEFYTIAIRKSFEFSFSAKNAKNPCRGQKVDGGAKDRTGDALQRTGGAPDRTCVALQRTGGVPGRTGGALDRAGSAFQSALDRNGGTGLVLH